jgi:hypothetical protein
MALASCCAVALLRLLLLRLLLLFGCHPGV